MFTNIPPSTVSVFFIDNTTLKCEETVDSTWSQEVNIQSVRTENILLS